MAAELSSIARVIGRTSHILGRGAVDVVDELGVLKHDSNFLTSQLKGLDSILVEMRILSESVNLVIQNIDVLPSGGLEIGSLGRSAKDVITELRLGRVEPLVEMYESTLNIKVPNDVRQFMSTFFERQFVDAELSRLLEIEKDTRELLGNKIYSARSRSDLSAFEQAKLYEFMKKYAKKLSPKGTLKTLFWGTVVVGSSFVFWETYESGANAAAGLFRIYVDTETGEKKSCKILAGTCNKDFRSAIGGNTQMCEQFPSSIKTSTCDGFSTDADNGCDCRGWDVTAPVDSPQYLDPKNRVADTDVYQCRPKPMIGDFVAQIVHNIPSVVSTPFAYITSLVVGLLKWIVVAVSIALFAYFVVRSVLEQRSTSRQHEQFEDEKDASGDDEPPPEYEKVNTGRFGEFA